MLPRENSGLCAEPIPGEAMSLGFNEVTVCLSLPLLVMIATQQEMNDAQLPLGQRDYCAHYLIKYLKCKRDMWPNFLECKHERHDWDYCEHEDYVMRMKEYERERRLLMRKKKMDERQAA
ncbi:NADH dehydrogenase [ubiquinone] 1 beta subcomplex subunit 7 [Rhincodon typus]|uniref:NADH dehydrogenase [ubiquinone] 1 beta subcomplex subunit 7 n=1 Tax=Rhincodon typus TaxID=259920 RepID=UPI00202DEC20|nr:NADH dehydrogenase [ubiquinone] 1 beta subcomplex subunit 7 [Rhincodon typus]